MIDDTYDLQDITRHFQRDGFVIVPAVVDPDRITQLKAAYEALLVTWSAELGVTTAEYERVVSQWTGMHGHHPTFRRQLHHPTIAAIARHLLQVERVQLFHDHFISKPPDVSSTIPWHQDYPFWPVDQPRALSCWLALDDADDDSGAMRFMPGAHREGEQPPVDFLRNQKDWGPRESQAVPTRLRAGDCVFHSCLSWHTSPPNRTRRQRRALITIIMSAECRYDPQHSGWHPMNALVTVPPGERFNEDSFPVLAEASEAESC